MNKLYRVIVFAVLFLFVYLFIKMFPHEVVAQYGAYFRNLIGPIITFVLGIVSIVSVLRGWKFLGIRSAIRKTKYGELLNAIVMISLGVCLLYGSIEMLAK